MMKEKTLPMDAIDRLCREVAAKRLLFLAETPAGEPPEIVVDWPQAIPSDAANRFFQLAEGLESIFGQPVTLIELHAVANPARKVEITRHGREVWHA